MSHATGYESGPSVCSFAIELPIYKVILSPQGSKWGHQLSFYQSENRCYVSSQILSLQLVISPFHVPWIFELVAKDLAEGLLLKTLAAYNDSLSL